MPVVGNCLIQLLLCYQIHNLAIQNIIRYSNLPTIFVPWKACLQKFGADILIGGSVTHGHIRTIHKADGLKVLKLGVHDLFRMLNMFVSSTQRNCLNRLLKNGFWQILDMQISEQYQSTTDLEAGET